MPIRRSLPLVRIAALLAILAGTAFALPAEATDRVVVVQPGDTLSGIALQHGLTVTRLLALNTIADPNRIYAGQRLRITGQPAAAVAPVSTPPAPAPVVHVVQPGEHLTGIARRYGTTIAAIAAANGIKNPSFLRVGWNLTIPDAAGPSVPAEATVATPPAAASVPRVHVVTSGQTLTAIARQYGTTISAIVGANGIKKPSYLRVGQKLTIPGSSAAPASATALPMSMAATAAARDDVRAILEAEATAQGVPVAFVLAVAWQESGWRAGVVSSAGAVGVMQLTPATADWVGSAMLGTKVDLRDPRSNVHAGIRLLQHYLARYHGDKALTLAAYYQGQTGADRHGVYRITRPYIASILALESLFAR